MLLSKQWSRVAGGVLAVVVFLVIFNFLDTKPYREYWRAKLPESTYLQSTKEDQTNPKLPYRPQDEGEQVGEKPPQSPEDLISDLTGSHEHKEPYRPQTEEQDIKQDFAKAGASSGQQAGNAPQLNPPADLPYRPQAEEQEGFKDHPAAKAEYYLPRTSTTTSSTTHTADGMPHAELSTATSTPSTSASFTDPTSTAFRKAVVMGKTSKEDTDWVQNFLPDWEPAIYVVDLEGNATSPTGLRTKMNKAREAMPYLTYMADHYDNFPDVAVFLHSHRKGYPKAWHNDAKGYDAVNMLKELKLAEVQRRGYTNLRCIDYPGCPNEVQLSRDEPKEVDSLWPKVYGEFFNMTEQAVKAQIDTVATPCCAQFAITRQQLHRRSKLEYQRFVALMEENDTDDHLLGTVMEYMWHVLFYQDAVYCDDTQHCWTELYGRPVGT